MDEYVKAEEAGEQDGECWRYYKDCPKSLFLREEENKYRFVWPIIVNLVNYFARPYGVESNQAWYI